MTKLLFAGISIAVLSTISVGPTSGVSFSFSNISEPATMLLVGTALVCFAVVGKKRFLKRKKHISS